MKPSFLPEHIGEIETTDALSNLKKRMSDKEPTTIFLIPDVAIRHSEIESYSVAFFIVGNLLYQTVVFSI